MRRAAPNNARLMASVPEEVNVTSVRPAPSACAARSRARSSAARQARPSVCGLDGLPSGRSRREAATSGRMGAPPASSRKTRFTWPLRAAAGSAPAVVRLVDELLQRALEAFQIEVQVEDLIDADRFAGRCRLNAGGSLHALDLLDRSACDRQHDDERHLALGAGDLQVEPLLLMAEDLDLTALQAAPAHRTVVEPGPIADE